MLALAIAGGNGGLLALNDTAITNSANGVTILVAIVVVLLLSMYAHAKGDAMGAATPKRLTVKKLADRTLSADVVEFVGSRGQVKLKIAGEVADMEGYPPLPAELRTAIREAEVALPADLPISELESRAADRLRTDFDLADVSVRIDERGHASVAAAPPSAGLSKRVPSGKRAVSLTTLVPTGLAADGTVTYLALGSRLAGIGPTLGPGTCAVAVEADPASDAAPGDIVQVWTTPDPAPEAGTDDGGEPVENAADGGIPTAPDGEGARRVTTAELRATAGETVTLVVDENDATALSPDERYRLVTLPAAARTDQESASLLRAADETLGVVEVPEGSPLVGVAVGDLDATVVAVRAGSGALDALPARERALEPGDSVYAIGRPDVLRGLADRAREEAVMA